MNPDEKLAELLVDVLGKPSLEVTNRAIANLDDSIKSFLITFKNASHTRTPIEQMAWATSSAAGLRDPSTSFFMITLLEALFAQAIWASAYNKTMPEAMKLYGDMLREKTR